MQFTAKVPGLVYGHAASQAVPLQCAAAGPVLRPAVAQHTCVPSSYAARLLQVRAKGQPLQLLLEAQFRPPQDAVVIEVRRRPAVVCATFL